MIAAHFALLSLIGLTPVILFFDNALVGGILDLYTGIVLAMIAFSIRQGEAWHLITSIRWAGFLILLPACWVIIQLLPLPLGAVSRSIWQSAATALNIPIWSHTTIDPGLTLLALCRYLSLVLVGLIAAAVTVDRRQAEKLFFALAGAAVVICLIIFADQIGGNGLLTDAGRANGHAAGAAASALGAVLLSAIMLMAVERFLVQNAFRRLSLLSISLAISIVGLLICILAAVFSGSAQAPFAAFCGVGTVAMIYFVRRIGLEWRAALAMAGLALVATVFVLSTRETPGPGDISLRYAAHASADQMSAADRMLGEVGSGGSGAGTFAALSRLYGADDTSVAQTRAPTFASQVGVELGRPALWLITGLAIVLILLCAKGAFDRGRDFLYSVAGAGVGVAAVVLAFSQTGIDNLAIGVLLASTLGLALVQSSSRTL